MSELENEFPEGVEARNLDATIPESKRVVEEMGFKNHGLVIRSSGGELLFKQPDHEVKMDEVRTKIGELVGK